MVLGDQALLVYSNFGLTRVQYTNRLVAGSCMTLHNLLMRPRVLLAFAAGTSMCLGYAYDRSLDTVIPRFEM